MLSSNINLSEEDFHKVAAELLMQQNLSSSELTSDTAEFSDQQCDVDSRTVTITTVPSETTPISIEISYKNVASSSDESSAVTNITENLSVAPPDSNQQTVKIDAKESQFKTNVILIDKNTKPVTKRRGGWPKGIYN